MKSWFPLLTIAFPAMACAAVQNVQIVYEDAAVIHFCDPRVTGCAERITIDGQTYLLDVSSTNQLTVKDLRNGYSARKLYKTEHVKTVGFVIVEKGHPPNPKYPTKVFKLLRAELRYPR